MLAWCFVGLPTMGAAVSPIFVYSWDSFPPTVLPGPGSPVWSQSWKYPMSTSLGWLSSIQIYLPGSIQKKYYLFERVHFFQFLFCSLILLGYKIVGFCNHLNISFILFNPSIPPRLSHIFFLIPLPLFPPLLTLLLPVFSSCIPFISILLLLSLKATLSCSLHSFLASMYTPF